jgi:DNA-directed RNA polymerase specialized sigma24 family protein
MGDERITRTEFSRFQTAVERWRRKLSAEERDEVIQQAAHAFCKRFPERGICSRPVNWLIKSARILASELVRKRIERRGHEQAIESELLKHVPDRAPAADAAWRPVVEVALSELPEDERWAVLNCDMLDLTVAEAARERRVSRSTMFCWRQRGRNRLLHSPHLESLGNHGSV